MRRISVVLAIALAFLAGSLSLTSATAHYDHKGKSDRGYSFKLTAVSDQSQEVDSAPTGPSVGDFYAFHDKLYLHKKQVGALDGVCHVTYLVDEETGTAQCLVTATLPRGTMTFQGVLDFDDDAFVIALTGGTKRFSGAEGQAYVRFLDETTTKIRVFLED